MFADSQHRPRRRPERGLVTAISGRYCRGQFRYFKSQEFPSRCAFVERMKPCYIFICLFRFPGVVIALAGMIVLSGCAAPWKRQQADRGLGAEMEGSLRYGPISGYVQTPRGGAPGTTSAQRPTFRELNRDDFFSPEVSLRLRWREHGLYAGASLVRLDGDSTLNTPLVSQGTSFPAGAAVKSEVQLDWYRLGYQYRITWSNEAGTSLSLSPAVGAALLNFCLLYTSDAADE